MKNKIKCVDCNNVFWQEEVSTIECENCGGDFLKRRRKGNE